MFVNEHPVRSALLPNSGIPEFHLRSLAILLRFLHQMHGHGRPRDRPAAAHFQILARCQFDLRRALQELLLHALVVFLPTVIRKGRHIIKYKSIFLAVELRRSIRISRTPGGAITVDKLVERGLVRGLLLRPGADKIHKSSEHPKPSIHNQAPPLALMASTSANVTSNSES